MMLSGIHDSDWSFMAFSEIFSDQISVSTSIVQYLSFNLDEAFLIVLLNTQFHIKIILISDASPKSILSLSRSSKPLVFMIYLW